MPNTGSDLSNPIQTSPVENFRALVDFAVAYTTTGNLPANLGVMITWTCARSAWQNMDSVATVVIEKAIALDGVFTEVARVPWSDKKYVDSAGHPDEYYRLKIIDNTGAESSYSNQKNAQTPPTAVVYGYVRYPDGKPVEGAEIYFSIPRFPAGDSSKNLLSRRPSKVVTNHTGYFEQELVRNIVVRVSCLELGLNNKEFIVPTNSIYVDLWDLI